MTKQQQKADIKIRLTEALRSKIEKSAKSRGVSMNADMIDRLERSFLADAALKTETKHREELDKSIDQLLGEIHKLHTEIVSLKKPKDDQQ